MAKYTLNKDGAIVTKEDKFESAMQWLTTGVDFESRRLDVIGDVCEAMEAIIVRALLKMSEINKNPIEIYLSSYGGDAYSGLAIYDAIRACECEVRILAKGKIMSAGSIIFLAGDVRLAAPSTRFMIHSISGGSEGKLKDMAVDLEEAKFINNRMIEIYAERTKMKNPKFWQKKLAAHDCYFGLTEASDFGMLKTSGQDSRKRAANVRRKTK